MPGDFDQERGRLRAGAVVDQQAGARLNGVRHTSSIARSLALGAVLAAALTGCGDGAGKPDPAAVPLVEDANRHMQNESFHASGTTTAFAGGKQETWWDPAQGLHMEVTGGVSGDVYCKDGTSYTSADLFAAALRRRGQQITVPAALRSVYVTTKSEQGCPAYFTIAQTGSRAADKDRSIEGKQASAVEVAAGSAEDVYFIETGRRRLLLLESRRYGHTSSTVYDSFGEKFTISLPVTEKTMTLEAFRARIG
ncbi:hypothetical protein AB0I68_26815 [Streptomyces sp. NPDC050448]|uniref:hypothetical protein n=1 Tax=Streptomyces sp. NPDC050448 TaxID=3155404 RepID=UPI00342EA59A